MALKLSVLCVAVLAIVLMCNAGVPQKREVKESDVVSDASQALDKLFEDLNTGIKKLASDGINMDGVLQNITAKASEFGNQVQQLGKELGEKVQEAAKKQGLTQ